MFCSSEKEVYRTATATAIAATRPPCTRRPAAPLSELGADVDSVAAAEEVVSLLDSDRVEVALEDSVLEESEAVVVAVESVAVESVAVEVMEPVLVATKELSVAVLVAP
jgi:hypothetical protein